MKSSSSREAAASPLRALARARSRALFPATTAVTAPPAATPAASSGRHALVPARPSPRPGDDRERRRGPARRSPARRSASFSDDDRYDSDDARRSPSSPLAPPPRRHYAVVLLTLTAMFLYADQNLLSPNLSAVAEEFGLSEREKDVMLGGRLQLAFFLVGSPASLLIGYLADDVPRLRLFALVVLVGEGPCLGTYWVETYWQLFAVRALTGVAVGGCLPCSSPSAATCSLRPSARPVASFSPSPRARGSPSARSWPEPAGRRTGGGSPSSSPPRPSSPRSPRRHRRRARARRHGGRRRQGEGQGARRERGEATTGSGRGRGEGDDVRGVEARGTMRGDEARDVVREGRKGGGSRRRSRGGGRVGGGGRVPEGLLEGLRAGLSRDSPRGPGLERGEPSVEAFRRPRRRVLRFFVLVGGDVRRSDRSREAPAAAPRAVQRDHPGAGSAGHDPLGDAERVFRGLLTRAEGPSVEEGARGDPRAGASSAPAAAASASVRTTARRRANIALVMGVSTALGSSPGLPGTSELRPGALFAVPARGRGRVGGGDPAERSVLLNVNLPETRGTMFAFISDRHGEGRGPRGRGGADRRVWWEGGVQRRRQRLASSAAFCRSWRGTRRGRENARERSRGTGRGATRARRARGGWGGGSGG